ncbi:hypothetical protein HJC23_011971 [Cyclotella cryptica]|uniref:Uncharacterized protein n=1 Tax=Cyclotella cryptica TaxID=29204 RepID=A0ABD3QQD5_9STRA|eukprot:CCRYP_003013-RA/>CCRYP_003013-RA protein AED:0.38 eAED:0.38 QI:0/-1/0/1/-1/1/1/0/273
MSEPATTDPAAAATTTTTKPQSQEDPASKPTDLSASAVTIGASNRTTTSATHRSSTKKRRSSLFERARASFYRSRGQTGASVETLRGTAGADFEGYALVERCSAEEAFECNPLRFCCCCCGNKDGMYFLLVKGYHCFVYSDEEGISPKFAVELSHRKAVVVQPARDAHCATVHLETSLGDLEYKFTFSRVHEDGNEDLAPATRAAAFVEAVSSAADAAQTEEVRTRLGHQNLLNKKSSVRYANAIGMAKAKDQPDAPVGMGEVLREMPVGTGL